MPVAAAAHPGRLAPVLKLAGYALGGAGVVIAAFFHFWFNTVSDTVKDTNAVTARVGAVEVRVGGLEGSVEHVHAEVKDMRKDQLEFYRWQAERAGDWARARAFSERLRQVK